MKKDTKDKKFINCNRNYKRPQKLYRECLTCSQNNNWENFFWKTSAPGTKNNSFQARLEGARDGAHTTETDWDTTETKQFLRQLLFVHSRTKIFLGLQVKKMKDYFIAKPKKILGL